MKRIYIPYTEWEDWHNGMWNKLDKEEEPHMLLKAIRFTSDYIKYGHSMAKVIISWPNTMLNSLTNKNINRRAFLGHCACSYEFNCPEYITRAAWKELTNHQRYLADLVAQKTINNWIYEYKRKNIGLHKNMGKQLLLQWDS